MTKPSASIPISIKACTWQKDQAVIRPVREKVYIQEQQVPVELEWDDKDAECLHLLALDHDDHPVATARMTPDGHIGRMAVLADYRHQSIGSQMLRLLCEKATEQGLKKVVLDAQTYAIPFYEKHGFSVTSDEFMDAGIPHKSMQKTL